MIAATLTACFLQMCRSIFACVNSTHEIGIKHPLDLFGSGAHQQARECYAGVVDEYVQVTNVFLNDGEQVRTIRTLDFPKRGEAGPP
jgi:hypothetical protein